MVPGIRSIRRRYCWREIIAVGWIDKRLPYPRRANRVADEQLPSAAPAADRSYLARKEGGSPMARSLTERQRAHEQQKARLAEQEAKLKADERKVRTRQLIQAGGLIDKAGLLDLDPNALYGALLSLKDGANDKHQVSQWTALGGRAFAREARLVEEGKEAIVLAFPAPLERDATTVLRGAGFRFNKLLKHWEGLARFDEASALAAAHGGAARRVGPAAPFSAAAQ
jgi:hypothetical protein